MELPDEFCGYGYRAVLIRLRLTGVVRGGKGGNPHKPKTTMELTPKSMCVCILEHLEP